MSVEVGDRVLFVREAGAISLSGLVERNLQQWEEGTVVRIVPTLVVETDDGSEFIVNSGFGSDVTKCFLGGQAANKTDLVECIASDGLGSLQRQTIYAVNKRFTGSCCAYATMVGSSMMISVNPLQLTQLPAFQPSASNIGLRVCRALESEANTKISVVVTGISGSGKTESAKAVVDEIVCTTSKSSAKSVSQLIASWNPIMECFGNASTPMNNNSSRFSKVLSMDFAVVDGVPRLGAARVTSFLLELTRVTFAATAQSNDPSLPMMRPFHIFGMMFQPQFGRKSKFQEIISPEKRKAWMLSDQTLFRVFSSEASRSNSPFTINDLTDALVSVGLDDETIESLFRILVGILHLLNIDFISDDAFSPASVNPHSYPASLVLAATLLFSTSPVDGGGAQRALGEELAAMLTTVSLGTVRRQLNTSAASAVRDSTARLLYSSLVQWVFSKLSFTDATVNNECCKTVNVVDIFGFESVKHHAHANVDPKRKPTDGFEQLLINHSNDVLQSLYEENAFSSYSSEVQQEGVAEAINRLGLSLPICSAKRSVDAITAKSSGLFSVLSDASTLAQQSATERDSNSVGLVNRIVDAAEARYRQQLDQKSINEEDLPVIRREKTDPTQFFVAHFCDVVRYSTADDWIKKNRLLNRGLASTLMNVPVEGPKNSLLGVILSFDRTTQPSSFVSGYQSQLESSLVPVIKGQQNSVFWIRCVKPNQENISQLFDGEYVCRQLNSSGIFRALELAANGYTIRLSHFEFVTKFLRPFFQTCFVSSGKDDFPLFITPPARAQFQKLLDDGRYRECCVWAAKTIFPADGKTKAPSLIVGTTLVFQRQSTLQLLQKKLQRILEAAGLLLQRVGRGFGGGSALSKKKESNELLNISNRRGMCELLLERRRQAFVRAALQRIEKERPLREALEKDRHALHSLHAGKARKQLSVFQRRALGAAKVLHHCERCKSLVDDSFSSSMRSFAFHDEQRFRVERAARSKDDSERATEKQRQQLLAEEEKRAAVLSQNRRQASLRLRETSAPLRRKQATDCDEKAIGSQITLQKRLVLRAKADVEAAELHRWEASYASQSLAVARRKLREKNLPPAPHSESFSSPAVSVKGESREPFQVQRDIWSLWERQ